MDNIADKATLGAVLTWIAAHIVQINEYLQAISFVVVIITGTIAIVARLVKFYRWLSEL